MISGKLKKKKEKLIKKAKTKYLIKDIKVSQLLVVIDLIKKGNFVNNFQKT